MARLGAGPLHQLVAFDSPKPTDDGHGGVIDGWTEQLRCRAAFRFLRGGEAVQASRLAGRQPVVVTIYQSVESSAIDTSWRMRDLRSGTAYNLRSIVPTDDRRFYEITAESGVAV